LSDYELIRDLYLRDVVARGRIVVVSGPPCSGKTTFAQQHRLDNDEVLDWDVVFAEVGGGLELYDQPPALTTAVWREFESRLHTFARGFVIRSAPTVEQRATLRSQLHGRSIVLATSAMTCYERLLASTRPEAAKRRGASYSATWWHEYPSGPV
jgi:predicted kinase